MSKYLKKKLSVKRDAAVSKPQPRSQGISSPFPWGKNEVQENKEKFLHLKLTHTVATE